MCRHITIHISKFCHTNLSNHVKIILMILYTLNMNVVHILTKIIFSPRYKQLIKSGKISLIIVSVNSYIMPNEWLLKSPSRA